MTNTKKAGKLKLFFLMLILTAVSVIIIYSSVSIAVQTVYPKQYIELIDTTADDFEIDRALLYALIKTESGFDNEAVSTVGAKGLTQITPETFDWLQTKTGENRNEDDLFDPEISVYYGAFFLDMLLDEFGNTETALAAYHAGRGKVNEWLADPRISPDGKTLEIIPYDDTASYVEKVIKTCEKYRRIYDM